MPRSNLLKHLVQSLALVLLLSACSFSLAADVTPLPNSSLPISQPTEPPPAETESPAQLAQSATPSGVSSSPSNLTPAGPAGPSPTASPVDVGTLTGTVKNLSGSPIPTGLTVTLHGFDDMQSTYTATAEVASDGTFSFPATEMPLGRAFIASLAYQDVTYSSDVVQVEEADQSLNLEIPIYESSTDLSPLIVDRLHLLLEYSDPGVLRVVELLIISNPSGKTIVSSTPGGPVLNISVPEGATNLQFQDGILGERYLQTPTGFSDTSALRPGLSQHQIVFSFDLPYTRKLAFSQPIDLPVSALIALIPEDGLTIKSNQLQDMGTRDVQGIPYHMYAGDQLDPGQNLELSISGSPSGTGAGLILGSHTNLLIGGLALGLALAAVGVWIFLSRRRAQDLNPNTSPDAEFPSEEAAPDTETLLDAILALDDKYQAGELSEEAYHQRRAELKSQLQQQLPPKDSPN